MTDIPASPNGHSDIPAALKRPAPHPAPSLAAQMAEADAQAQAAAKAEVQRQQEALHGQIAVMLATDPAALVMNLPDLFGQALVEMVAAGVQLGLQRAAQAERQQAQQTPAEAAAKKPILLAQAPLSAMMIREAGGVPGVPGAG